MHSFSSYPFDSNKLQENKHLKVSDLIKKGEIIQIKRGLYISSLVLIDKKLLANLLHGPSYISLEYALSYWGLIPERVETVTSINFKKTKTYQTPLGFFSYHRISQNKFSAPGIRWLPANDTGFLIATAERALVDKLYLDRITIKKYEMALYLEEYLRVDLDEVHTFDMELINELAQCFNHPSVTALRDWLLE